MIGTLHLRPAVILAITLFVLYTLSAWAMLRSVKHPRLEPLAWVVVLVSIIGHSDAINVAPALKHYPSDWFGHSYYYRNPIVSQDVIRALLTTDPPAARGIRPDPDLPGILALPENPPPATLPATRATPQE